MPAKKGVNYAKNFKRRRTNFRKIEMPVRAIYLLGGYSRKAALHTKQSQYRVLFQKLLCASKNCCGHFACSNRVPLCKSKFARDALEAKCVWAAFVPTIAF
jgi:hypothetical protein